MTKRERQKWRERFRKIMGDEIYERIERMDFQDEGMGYDKFGLEIESSLITFMVVYGLYKYWFRVESEDINNVPDEGPLLITPNHAGVLPFDGAMIAADIALKHPTPRVSRAVIDFFFYNIPFLNIVLARSGQLIGTRNNFKELLKAKNSVIVFPEGAKGGTGKLFKDRYNLGKWNVGFIELAIKHKSPIVPVAVIGGEEQYPLLYNVKPIADLVKFPYFPLTPFFPWFGLLGALPLPTKYKIRYGEPLYFYKDYDDSVLKEPDIIKNLADQVRAIVQEMVDDMLSKRKGVFSG